MQAESGRERDGGHTVPLSGGWQVGSAELAALPSAQPSASSSWAALGGTRGIWGALGTCRAAWPRLWRGFAALGSLPGSGWVTSRGPGSASPQQLLFCPELSGEPRAAAGAGQSGCSSGRLPRSPQPRGCCARGCRISRHLFVQRVPWGPCLRLPHPSSCCWHCWGPWR